MTDDRTGLFDLSGRVALVTGASSGLGRAIAEGLAAHGAAIAALDVDEPGAVATAEGVRGRGGRAIARHCDVTDRRAVDATVTEVVHELGRLDVLVTSAGIGARAAALEMTEAQWSRVLDVNLTGTWNSSRAAGEAMRGSGGSIIHVASIAGLVGVTTGNANYAASKGGVIAMMRTLALEWAPLNIRVNALAPTHFRTPLIEAAIEERPELLDYFEGTIPMGRLGEPHELVGPAVFLASAASSMVTGHVLTVDGGHTAR